MSYYKSYYAKRKAQLRDAAIEWMITCGSGEVLFWSDIAEKTEYFRYWGKRFGLLTELKENAII